WGPPGRRVFAGDASFSGFSDHVSNDRNNDVDQELLDRFEQELARAEGGHARLQERYEALRDVFKRVRTEKSALISPEVRRQRAAFVGELRERLAHACVAALRPDLVILDEFQRFRQLFDPKDPAGDLASTLFEFEDVAVLMLSATPYRMYTQADEDEDHHRDFLETIEFLSRDPDATGRLAHDITMFRQALLASDPAAREEARAARVRIETRLRTVMSRYERLAVSEDRSGMLDVRDAPELHLTVDDVRQFRTLRVLGERLGVGGATEYWEATPHPLSHLEGYVFGQRFRTQIERDPALPDGLDLKPLILDLDDVRRYAKIDPGNARMRSLQADTLDRGLWGLVWLPPSLLYHQLGGPYAQVAAEGVTKRLVFSAWTVVPRAIATHLSYEAERRMMAGAPMENTAEARDRFSPLLTFTRGAGQLRGMRLLGLLYPSA
ncbi:MAG: hypothetical protein WD942_03655, partial [Dehalococcoidia bacterium]